eukprot:4790716-Pleurochrysis_carterae.AAC.2
MLVAAAAAAADLRGGVAERLHGRSQHRLHLRDEHRRVHAQQVAHVAEHPLRLVPAVGLAPALEVESEALEHRLQEGLERPEARLGLRIQRLRLGLGRARRGRLGDVLQQQRLAHGLSELSVRGALR